MEERETLIRETMPQPIVELPRNNETNLPSMPLFRLSRRKLSFLLLSPPPHPSLSPSRTPLRAEVGSSCRVSSALLHRY